MVSDCGGLFVWVVEWRILVIAESRYRVIPAEWLSVKCHTKNGEFLPSATSKVRQVPHQKCAKCHIKNAPNAIFGWKIFAYSKENQ